MRYSILNIIRQEYTPTVPSQHFQRTMSMTAKQIGKRIKAKGLGRLKWYCQMCQKQCRDENGFKCHTASESHLRQMELFAQNPAHYLDQLSNEFETNFLKLLSRRFNTTSVDANKVYNEYVQDKEHTHMNATKWETLSGFVQYLGRTGKVRVEESERGLYITWVDRNPEALARAEKQAKKQRATLDDIAANERLMKQRLALAKLTSSSSSLATARPTERDDTAAGVNMDSHGNIVLGLTTDGTSSSKLSRKRPSDSRPTLMFGRGASGESSAGSVTSGAVDGVAAPTVPATAPSVTTRPTISFQLPPTKRARHDDYQQSGTIGTRSKMWMCEGLVVKIKNKTVGGGAFYKKKARISNCNRTALTADVRVIDVGTKIRIHQKDLETVIPKPNLSNERSRVMLLQGDHRGLTGTLIVLHVDSFNCDVELDDGTQKKICGIEYEDVSKVLIVDPYKKAKKSKKKKKKKDR